MNFDISEIYNFIWVESTHFLIYRNYYMPEGMLEPKPKVNRPGFPRGGGA